MHSVLYETVTTSLEGTTAEGALSSPLLMNGGEVSEHKTRGEERWPCGLGEMSSDQCDQSGRRVSGRAVSGGWLFGGLPSWIGAPSGGERRPWADLQQEGEE